VEEAIWTIEKGGAAWGAMIWGLVALLSVFFCACGKVLARSGETVSENGGCWVGGMIAWWKDGGAFSLL